MNISPIQVRDIGFRRVSIELDMELFTSRNNESESPGIDFDGAELSTNIGIAPAKGGGDGDERAFFLTLRVTTTGEGEVVPIYKIDVEAGGVVVVSNGVKAKDDDQLREIAAINGSGVLWSAIREQVATVTGRMPSGVALLPTVNFLDLRGEKPRPPSNASSPARKPGSEGGAATARPEG